MRFPGTITIPDATFEKVVEYAARSFRLHGFRDIVLLGDHGDYRKSLKAVAERLDREWASSAVRVHAIDEYYVAADTLFAQALKRQGYRDERSARTPALPTPRSQWRSTRASCAPTGFAPPNPWDARTAFTAIRGARQPSSDRPASSYRHDNRSCNQARVARR